MSWALTASPITSSTLPRMVSSSSSAFTITPISRTAPLLRVMDPLPRLAREIARELGRKGDRQAVPGLLEALHGTDRRLSRYATHYRVTIMQVYVYRSSLRTDTYLYLKEQDAFDDLHSRSREPAHCFAAHGSVSFCPDFGVEAIKTLVQFQGETRIVPGVTRVGLWQRLFALLSTGCCDTRR